MRTIGAMIGVIFGLFFAGMGGYIAWETTLPTFLNWVEAREWQATEGTIIAAGGADNGVTASYSYRVGRDEYLGKRVYLAEFKDNFGSYHREMRSYLREKERTVQPVTIWFDPDNPADSIIDRDMRWGLFALTVLFWSIFVLIGLTLAAAGFRGGARVPGCRPTLANTHDSRQMAQASGEFKAGFTDYLRAGRYPPDAVRSNIAYTDPSLRPWLRNPHWKTGRIRSNAKRGMYQMWGFALLWNAICSPVLWAFGEELRRGNYAIFVGLLFPLVGFFLLKRAWKMTREWRRFGVIELEMDPYPGAIDGHVGGRLRINGIYESGCRYQLELSCRYSHMTGSGEDRSRRENTLWSEQGVAHAAPTTSASGSGTLLSFRFSVPDELPESDVEQSGDYCLWRLGLRAELPGVSLERDYTIPVFRTGQRDSSVTHDLSRQAVEQRNRVVESSTMALNAGAFDRTALARTLRYSDQGGVARFYYPMFRNKALTLFSLLFAVGFGFASISIISTFGGDGGFGIVAMLFSLPFVIVSMLATAATLYLPLANLRVEIGNGTLQVTRRLFIVPIRRYRLATHDVTRIEATRTGSTGEGSGMVVHFKLSACTKADEKITIAKGIDGEALATAFKNFLEKRLGIASAGSREPGRESPTAPVE